jgi:hypothetical protein
MTRKMRLWLTLLAAWLVNVLPTLAHVENHDPSIHIRAPDHDPDGESERSAVSQGQRQGTEIAPPPAPLPPFGGHAQHWPAPEQGSWDFRQRGFASATL